MSINKKAAAVGLILLGNSAQAINLTSYQFTDSFRYSTLEDSGVETFSRRYVLTSSYSHIESPLLVTDKSVSTVRNSYINSYDLLTLGLGYRLNQDLSFGFNTSIVNAQVLDKSKTSFADSELKLKKLLFKQDKASLSINPEIILPTGQESTFSSGKQLGARVRGVYETSIENFHFLASAGFSHQNQNKYQIINYQNLLVTELGVSFDLSDKTNLNLELNRNFTFATDYRQDDGDYFVTIKHRAYTDASIYGGVGVAGINEVDRENLTAFVGVKLSFGEALPSQAVASKTVVTEEVKPKVESKIVERIIIKTVEDEEKLGKAYLVSNVYFENNKTSIRENELKKLEKLLGSLEKDFSHIKQIVIEGYASRVGKAQRNQVLSHLRAEEVTKYLVVNGVSRDLISMVAYGDKSKIQFENIEMNRRVQIRVYLNDKK